MAPEEKAEWRIYRRCVKGREREKKGDGGTSDEMRLERRERNRRNVVRYGNVDHRYGLGRRYLAQRHAPMHDIGIRYFGGF